MPVIERRRAFGGPPPELVEGRPELPSQQGDGGLHLSSSRMLSGFQVPVDTGQQPARDNQPRLLVVQLDFRDNLLRHSRAVVTASGGGLD